MNRRDGGPAFPGMQQGLVVPVELAGQAQAVTIQQNGMSVRDYFAAHAPITLEDARNHWKRTDPKYGGNWPDMCVLLAVLAKLRGEYADTMVAERSPT